MANVFGKVTGKVTFTKAPTTEQDQGVVFLNLYDNAPSVAMNYRAFKDQPKVGDIVTFNAQSTGLRINKSSGKATKHRIPSPDMVIIEHRSPEMVNLGTAGEWDLASESVDEETGEIYEA